MAQQTQIQLGIMSWRVRSLASLSGLRIRHCHELWGRSQTWLGSGVAVAVAQAGGYSSYSTPSLGTSICHRCSPKKQKKKEEEEQCSFPVLQVVMMTCFSLCTCLPGLCVLGKLYIKYQYIILMYDLLVSKMYTATVPTAMGTEG